MRPGADQRTQVCRGMNCKVIRKEADMVPAWSVKGNKARGWYCMRCAQKVKDAKKRVQEAQNTVSTTPHQAQQLEFPPESYKQVGTTK